MGGLAARRSQVVPDRAMKVENAELVVDQHRRRSMETDHSRAQDLTVTRPLRRQPERSPIALILAFGAQQGQQRLAWASGADARKDAPLAVRRLEQELRALRRDRVGGAHEERSSGHQRAVEETEDASLVHEVE